MVKTTPCGALGKYLDENPLWASCVIPSPSFLYPYTWGQNHLISTSITSFYISYPCIIILSYSYPLPPIHPIIPHPFYPLISSSLDLDKDKGQNINNMLWKPLGILPFKVYPPSIYCKIHPFKHEPIMRNSKHWGI